MSNRVRCGNFEIWVWEGGWPIWAEVFYENKKIAQINTTELRDLAYAVDRARSEARVIAQTYDKERANEY